MRPDRRWVRGVRRWRLPQRLGQLRGGGGRTAVRTDRCPPAGQGVPGQIRRRQLGSLGVGLIGQPRGGLPQRVLRLADSAEDSSAVGHRVAGVCHSAPNSGGWHRCLLDNGVHVVPSCHTTRHRRAGRSPDRRRARHTAQNRLVSIAASLSGWGREVRTTPCWRARTAFIGQRSSD